MNLQQLRYARAVAEYGSFVRAASECAVTQPTLSNGIAQLETELGQQLFARTTRKVQLTEAGEQLLPDIVDVLKAQQMLMARARALADPRRRVIRIGVSPVVGVKFVDIVLEAFRSGLENVEIVFRELNLAEMLDLLRHGQLDFVFGPVDAAIDGFNSAAFHEEPLMFVPNRRTRDRYRKADSTSLTEIASETFVLVPDTCGLTQSTHALFRVAGLELREYSGQAMSYGVLAEWAGLGIGSAIVPQSKLEGDDVTGLPISERGKLVTIQYRALWRGGPEVSDDVSKLGTFLRDVAPSIVHGLAS